MRYKRGQSGNPGGRPRVLAEIQELASQHAPEVIAELARLAVKGRRELLDRGFGRARQGVEVSLPENNIVRTMLDEIDARNREDDRRSALNWKPSGSEKSSAQ